MWGLCCLSAWRLCWAGPYLQVWGWKVPLWVLEPCHRLISVAPAWGVPAKNQEWALPAQVLKGEGGHLGLQPVPDCPSSFPAELGAGSLRQRLLRKSPTLLLLSAPHTLTPTLDPREPRLY